MRVVLLAAIALLTACGPNAKIDVMFECPSPSGSKLATFYRVSHGDNPINHEMKINIRNTHRNFDDSMSSFTFKDGFDVIIHWDTDQAMRIIYPQDSTLTHQETVVFGTSQSFDSTKPIQISYQQLPSTHGYLMVEQRCFTAKPPS